MAIDTKTFVRGVALWLMVTAAGFVVVFFGMSYAVDRFPNDLSASLSSPAEGDASMPPGAQPRGGQGNQGRGGALDLPPPSFRLATLDGTELGPPDFAGDVVVVDLWATWCGPCRLQAQFLDQLHKQYEGKGVHFLAVDTGEDESTVRAYVQKKPFPYPVLLDPQQTVQLRYRANGLPTILVIDRSGRVSFFQVGVVDAATLRAEIEKALASQPQQLV